MIDDTSKLTTMLGTYVLDGDAPVEPEIVLANCTDPAQLGQLMAVFEGNPDIRFFLINGIDEASVDLGGDFHFLKDAGTWVLANDNTMMDVLFDNADFNPTGNESTFNLLVDANGDYSLMSGQTPIFDDVPVEHLLVDVHEDDIFVDDSVLSDGSHDGLFVDPSVLGDGENEIVVSNFTVGSDTLDLPDGLSIKDVVVDNEHDLTQVIIAQNDTGHDDIVVKLLGVSQPDLPMQDYGLDADTHTDDLINHLIHSGMNVD